MGNVVFFLFIICFCEKSFILLVFLQKNVLNMTMERTHLIPKLSKAAVIRGSMVDFLSEKDFNLNFISIETLLYCIFRNKIRNSLVTTHM